MYNVLSMLFLFLGLISKNSEYGFEYFKICIIASIGFAIAGSIGSVAYRLNELMFLKIRNRKLNESENEIVFEKTDIKEE